MIRLRVFDDVLKRWFWRDYNSEGGSGETPTLAEVLVEGGDPDGNPITGILSINPQGEPEYITEAGLTVLGGLGSGNVVLYIVGAETQNGPLFVIDDNQNDANDVFIVGHTGAVTISPTDPTVAQFKVKAAPDPDDEYSNVLDARDNAGAFGLQMDNHGGFSLVTDGDGSVISILVGGRNVLSAVKQGSQYHTRIAGSDPQATLSFFGVADVQRPEIPASPDAQDIVDVLVALGLATQAS